MNIEIVETPDNSLMEFFERKIEEFNLARWEVKRKEPLAVRVLDGAGAIVAGAAARTFGSWLLIDNLWVEEKMRGQDIGSKILARLEEAAKARGCQYALLDTLNFQARPFYERFGYEVKWIQEHYPREGCKFFMQKHLSAPPTSGSK